MGVGLNYGWGIEGAIGSELKVDASYLSPNVNTAARLETANHQFGTKMLMAENVVMMMSPENAATLRCVECVRPKGVKTGIRISTCDFIESLDDPFSTDETLVNTDSGEKKRKDLSSLPKCSDPKFQELYKTGFEHYFKGEWPQAKDLMSQCVAIDPKDVPAQVILEQMADRGDTWKDYWKTEYGVPGSGRALTSK